MSSETKPAPGWGLPLRLLALATFFTFVASAPLWQDLWSLPGTDGGRLASMAALTFGLNAMLMSLIPLGPRPLWVAVPLMLVGAALLHFALRFGVVLSPQMMHNAMLTDTAEVGELVNTGLLADLALFGLLPAAILAMAPLGSMPGWRRALFQRAGVGALGLALALTALLADMSDLAPLMREHKALRYRFAPGNLIASTLSAVHERSQVRRQPRIAIDDGVRARAMPPGDDRRRIVVMVVGETVRSANWGLAGYERQTTPGLAARDDLLALTGTSCGTDTASSLPCMFSDVRSADYDRTLVAGRENLLDLAARAGVTIRWVDAQAGCKGVCDRVATTWLRDRSATSESPHCADGVCRDMALLDGFDALLDSTQGDVLVVLHQMGNHGPGYWRRVPEDEVHYRPVCVDDDLSRCEQAALVNAYDNAVRYTDHMLTTLIETLERRSDREDVAMFYVSDHGESLGEHGLYLHGMPRWMAPSEQTRVPMVLWLSAAWREQAGLTPGCARSPALAEVGHDQVFHTVIGLLGLRTTAHDPGLDLLDACQDSTSAQDGSR